MFISGDVLYVIYLSALVSTSLVPSRAALIVQTVVITEVGAGWKY